MALRFAFAAAALAILGLGCIVDPVAAAEPSASAPATSIVRKTLEIPAGKAIPVQLGDMAIARDVLVADPKVADARLASATDLFIVGLAEGTTTITVSDIHGRLLAMLDVAVSRDLSALRQTINKVLTGSKVAVQSVGNTILLTGTVSSAVAAQQAVDIAGAFVGTGEGAGKVINAMTLTANDQVMLRVTVAEVNRNVIKQLGISIAGDWQLGDFGHVDALTDLPFGRAGHQISNTFVTASGSDGSMTLRALEQAGMARLLAEPNLTAVSGETANLLVGGEVPIPSGISCDNNNSSCLPSIEYKKFGISLAFTPVVLNDGRISLRVATEVSDVDPANQLVLPAGGQTFAIPGFSLRKSENTVEVPSGGSMVTAGLIQEQTRQAISGVPGLMNVPILGTLFRSRDYLRQETELMISVTPILARASNPDEIVAPTKRLRDATDPEAVLLGRMNRISRPAAAVSPADAGSTPNSAVTGFIID